LLHRLQKPEEWIEPMKSKQVKEAKDKKAVFTARFSKENMKAKWYFKRDVSLDFALNKAQFFHDQGDQIGRFFTIQTLFRPWVQIFFQ